MAAFDTPISYALMPPIEEKFKAVNTWEGGAVIGAPFLSHYMLLACGPEFLKRDPVYGYKFYTYFFSHRGSTLGALWDKDEWTSRIRMMLASPAHFRRRYEEWILLRDTNERMLEEVRGSASISVEAYAKLEETHLAQAAHAFYPEYFTYSDELLGNLVSRHPDVLQAIEPLESTFISRYEDALAECALGQLRIEEVVKKFYWVRNNYRDTDMLTREAVEGEVAELEKQSESDLKARLARSRTRSEMILDLREKVFAACTPEERSQIETFALAAQWLDQRKEMVLKTNSVINRYLREQSQKLGVDFISLQFLLPEELRLIQRRERMMSDFAVADRKEMCVETFIESLGITIVVGEDAKQLYKYFDDFHQHESGITELRGQVACKGRASGVVRIVEDPNMAHDFPAGAILIAYMTRPEYVPLMKKAAAIVTNEGGLMSHAAIVARELGKPCIVGTRNATTVFKDGDMVEVDAENGIVRKL